MGFAGYPTLRLMTLVETGTRGLISAMLGSAGDRDEAGLARRLLPRLRPGMLVLADRASGGPRCQERWDAWWTTQSGWTARR